MSTSYACERTRQRFLSANHLMFVSNCLLSGNQHVEEEFGSRRGIH